MKILGDIPILVRWCKEVASADTPCQVAPYSWDEAPHVHNKPCHGSSEIQCMMIRIQPLTKALEKATAATRKTMATKVERMMDDKNSAVVLKSDTMILHREDDSRKHKAKLVR